MVWFIYLANTVPVLVECVTIYFDTTYQTVIKFF